MKRRIFAEFTGTFALVFCGVGAIVIDQFYGGQIGHLGIGLTFGLIVMAVIYAIGDISGAHINPAVTAAFWLSRTFSGREVIPYIGAQIGGAILAALTIQLLFPHAETLGETIPSGTILQSFVMEVILTMILMFVIIQVSTGSKEIGVMAGIAIGGTVALEAIFAGPVSGASMNPARSLGPAFDFRKSISYMGLYNRPFYRCVCIHILMSYDQRKELLLATYISHFDTLRICHFYVGVVKRFFDPSVYFKVYVPIMIRLGIWSNRD